MRAVVQRVSAANVQVQGLVVGAIESGLVVLLGIAAGDSEELVERMAQKVARLRVFEDSEGRMNLSLADVAGAVLCISQFTLFADVRRGNRPSFESAAPAAIAEPLYERFCHSLESTGIRCERGLFGARMRVTLTNDGPLTILIDSNALDAPRRT